MTSERKLDPEAICTRAMARLIEQIGCVDIAPDSPAWEDITQQGKRVGELRVYRGRATVEKVVSAHFRLEAPAIDSCMMVVFTRPESPVPHFVLDVVRFGERASFHVDLLPKRDLGVCLSYVDLCFSPLSEVLEDITRDARFAPGTAPLRQRALLSPWMALFTHAPNELEAARSYVDRYFAHWCGLLRSDSPLLARDAALTARDEAQRKLVFGRELDPVWGMLDRALGAPAVDRLLQVLTER